MYSCDYGSTTYVPISEYTWSIEDFASWVTFSVDLAIVLTRWGENGFLMDGWDRDHLVSERTPKNQSGGDEL